MSLKKTIKFSKNWNGKLNNLFFTTIRKSPFWVNENDFCVIALENKLFKYAKCVKKETTSLKDINPALLMSDIGLDIDGCIKVLANLGLDYNDLNCTVEVLTLKTMPSQSQYAQAVTNVIAPTLFTGDTAG